MEDSQKGVLLDMAHEKHAAGIVVLNISRSGYLTAPYEEKVVAKPKDTSDRIAEKLQHSVHVMTTRADQLTGVEKNIHSFLMQALPNCRPMKTEEKIKLHQRIHKLAPVSLTRVMDIIPLENTCGSTTDIQIDLEALDSSTLWRLHFFVKMITEFTPEPAKKKLDNKGHACGESSVM